MIFLIPEDPEEADKETEKQGSIATASEFTRAALVYARVDVGDSDGRPTKTVKRDRLAAGKVSPAEYARLGIHGLRSKNTVQRYWNVWNKLVAEGRVDPAVLGKEVDIPIEDCEWNTYYLPAADADIPVVDEPIPEEKERKPRQKKPVWAEQEQSDKAAEMGQGDCPPRASSIDDDEDVPEAPEFIDVNLPEEDLETEECFSSSFNPTLFRFHLGSTKRDIASVNECLADMDDEDELPEGTKESIDSIIEAWTDIKVAVSKKKEREETE